MSDQLKKDLELAIIVFAGFVLVVSVLLFIAIKRGEPMFQESICPPDTVEANK